MFNPPTPILFSLFFRFLLVKHAVHVPDNGTGLPNQARFESKTIASLFIFIFFFNPPKKYYSFTAEQEGSGNGKNVCGAISSDSTCAKDLKSPKEGSL